MKNMQWQHRTWEPCQHLRQDRSKPREIVSRCPVAGSFRCFLTSSRYLTFMWTRIVTNFFIIKPNSCTTSTNFTRFGQFLCPSSEVYLLYTQQWYMSYTFVDSFRAGPGWNSSPSPAPSWPCSIAVYKPLWHIPLPSVQRINSWWWTE